MVQSEPWIVRQRWRVAGLSEGLALLVEVDGEGHAWVEVGDRLLEGAIGMEVDLRIDWPPPVYSVEVKPWQPSDGEPLVTTHTSLCTRCAQVVYGTGHVCATVGE
jgi:hypothetical protein